MNTKKTKIGLMLIGGVIGLAICYFDAMISYAETASPEYSGFKIQIQEYTPFIVRAIGFTLIGIVFGWLIGSVISYLRTKS